MQLTKNFKLNEFTRSATADKYGIDNTPSPSEVANIKALCEKLLQPLRDCYLESFYINSGFRCKDLNDKIPNSSKTSQHITGQAADIRVSDPRDLLTKLLDSNLEFDQAILYGTFLHLSYNPSRNRKQVLYAKGVSPL